MTGTQATTEIGIAIIAKPCPRTMKRVAENAIIMVAMEMKSVVSPIISLFGNDCRKSSSAYREVRMDRKIKIEVTEENRANASDTAKTINDLCCMNIGLPVLLLLPPGTVNAAANMTVAIRVATTMHEDAVSFIHFSPSRKSPLCSSENSIRGVNPCEFFISR